MINPSLFRMGLFRAAHGWGDKLGYNGVINMVTILMMSEKMATLGLLKIKIF